MKILLTVFLFMPAICHSQEKWPNKVFFANSPMSESYFYTQANYTAPGWIKNVKQKLPVTTQHFFSPGNALELNYVSAANGNWQANILYHSIRGLDNFQTANVLTFHLFINTKSTAAQMPAIAIGKDAENLSSFIDLEKYLPLFQTKKWLTVKIPITDFNITAIDELNTISFKQNASDGGEHQLFIDDLEFSNSELSKPFQSSPKILTAKGYEKHVDITWQPVNDPAVKYIKVYRSTDAKHFYPVGIQSTAIPRYADYTDTTEQTFFYKISLLNNEYKESAFSAVASAATKPLSNEALLNMAQEAHFRYYWEGAEPNSGLALENIPGRSHMVAAGASGFGMMALIAGAERKFITRSQLTERFDRITSFLEKAEKFHGAFPHFIDGLTGKVIPFFGEKDNGGDLVETAFLMQGLLTAKQYFDGDNAIEKNIRDRIENIWEGIEWDWYRRYPDSKFLYWHWSPDKEWVINHRLIGWNETMIVYLLGISSPTHPIPPSMYYTGWASQEEFAQQYRSAWGQTKDGSHYTNGNSYFGIPLKVGVSNGGPLFFIHYSFMGFDPHKLTDAYTNYFDNNRNIALINYRYCIENPEKHTGYGKDGWGLTASDGLWNYAADEPVPHADHGKLTPTGALASFPYTPEQSMDALKNYYRNYGKFLWGEYGFKDAFNLDENWCSEIFMGLNQAPITVMIENYRSGLIWKLFMSNTDIQNGLNKLSIETKTATKKSGK